MFGRVGLMAGLYDTINLAPTGTRSPDQASVSTDQKLTLNSSHVCKGRFQAQLIKFVTSNQITCWY